MPKIVDKAAKKNEILLAAMRLFAEKGVVNSKMADIAIAAGIGKGTIYEYFRSKEEIFGEAFSTIHRQAGVLAGNYSWHFHVLSPLESILWNPLFPAQMHKVPVPHPGIQVHYNGSPVPATFPP